MGLSYLLDKEGSLQKLEELKKYGDVAKECFVFTLEKILFVDWKDECKKRSQIGYGSQCLRYLNVLLWMESSFISNQELKNFDLRLGFGHHGFPSLGSWQADLEFIKKNRQGEYHCDYWDYIEREELYMINIKEKGNYICFMPNDLGVCFSYSKERFVMTNYSDFCLIVLKQNALQKDANYFERAEAPKNFYYYGGFSGLRGMDPLDYWDRVGPSGKTRLWMRGRGYPDLVWFFMSGKLSFSDILTLSSEELEAYHYLVIEIEGRKENESLDDICRDLRRCVSSEKIKYLVSEHVF